MRNKLIYFTIIFIFLVLITGISAAKPYGRIEENDTGKIRVLTSLSWNPGAVVPSENIAFTISGPERYLGNGSYWTKKNASAGTYTINYRPVKGYKTPASETKTLTAGSSITFSGNYTLKKKVGESLDFGDGYIVLIKQIDSKKKEVLMKIQLDGRIIDEKRLKENDNYVVKKRSYSVNDSGKPRISKIILGNISQDAGGDFTDIYIEKESYLNRVYGGYRHYGHGHGDRGDRGYGSVWIYRVIPQTSLIIISSPKGADIDLDGIYVGKTSKKILIQPGNTFKIHLKLEGYKSWEKEYNINTSNPKPITVPLNKT